MRQIWWSYLYMSSGRLHGAMGWLSVGKMMSPFLNCHSRGENSANKSRSASWGLFIHFWVAGVAGPDTTGHRRTCTFIRQRAYSTALPQLRQPKSRSPKFITLRHRQCNNRQPSPIEGLTEWQSFGSSPRVRTAVCAHRNKPVCTFA